MNQPWYQNRSFQLIGVVIILSGLFYAFQKNKARLSELTEESNQLATEVLNSKPAAADLPISQGDKLRETLHNAIQSEENLSLKKTQDKLVYAEIETPLQRAKKKVAETIKIDIDLPSDFTYEEKVFDDIEGVRGIQGFNQATGTHLVLVGINKPVSQEEIILFLKESGNELPGFSEEFLAKLSEPKKGEAHGGFQVPLVWEVEVGGKTVTIAVSNRADGKGAYVGYFHGPSEYLSDHEERFQNIYDNTKAK